MTDEKWTIAIHALIDSMQASNGMRNDDYKQYRAYCTRRLYRVRHNEAVKKELVHSATYVAGEKMRKNAYCPRALPVDVGHENILLSVLVEAERAWAHGNELKSIMVSPQLPTNSSTQAPPSRIRHQALRRFRKATKFATRLEELCAKHCDERTKEEAQAYASWMKGTLALEANDWSVSGWYDRFCLSFLILIPT